MDPFATYTHIATPQQFWAELDELLDQPPAAASNGAAASDEDQRREHAALVLQSFLALCDYCFDDNLSGQYNQDYAIHRLFDSLVLRDDPATLARPGAMPMRHYLVEKAVKIVQTATSIPVILLSYELVLQYGETYPDTYKALQASATSVSFAGIRAFLHRLVHQIWAGSYAAQAEAKIGPLQHDDAPVGWTGADWHRQVQHDASQPDRSAPRAASRSTTSQGPSTSASKQLARQVSLRDKAVQMLYEICRVQKLEPSHLKAFDERFINHLFDLVEDTRLHHDERFNYQLIKLIASINEQYMVLGIAASASNATGPDGGGSGGGDSAPLTGTRPINIVMDVLKSRLNASKTFGENLIFMLNRASSSNKEDLCMQLLILKLLYLLFTTKETACYFYTNDLKVLVDIFIRELSDLPDESESLRHTYLRVLHPLLTNTQLCTYPYKRPQIRRLLVGLVSHGHLREIGATTRRLVDRCLRAEWCVELDKLDGISSVATVAPIGGGKTKAKKMESGVTSEGLPMLSTKIETSKASDVADAAKVAHARDESEPQLSPIDGASLSSPISPADSASSSSGGDVRSSSLVVPGQARSRSKRVLSLSNPKTAGCDAGADARGTPSSHPVAYRRVVSAKSAPPTPPRIDSLDPAVAVDDDEGSDAMSNASSWHAHMADVPARSAKRTLSSTSSATGEVAPTTTHHPYLHHSSTEAISHPPRFGSPLSSESTYEYLQAASLGQRLDETDEVSSSSSSSWQAGHQDGRSRIGRGLPSLHVRAASNGEREGSDLTIRYEAPGPRTESRSSSISLNDQSDTGSAGLGGSPRLTSSTASLGGTPLQRRRPPEPPSLTGSSSIDRQARWALHTSSSEPGVAVCRGPLPAPGGDNAAVASHPQRASTDTSAAAAVATAAEPAISTAYHHLEHEATTMSNTSSTPFSSSTRRRRPPPPPPDRGLKPGIRNFTVTAASSRSGTPKSHHAGVGAATDEYATQRGHHMRVATEPGTGPSSWSNGRREEEPDLDDELVQERNNHLLRQMAAARIG